jgi:3-oxoacyl-[acyl-carrier protein] reductase
MPTSLMLQDKRAVVFGGGGSIGAAVARELATEGAEVFLAGRASTSVEAVAKQITAAGGRAHSAVIDALDGPAVDDYIEAVVQQAGSLDIEFNATGPRVSEYGNGKLAADLPIGEFMLAVDTVLQSQFITARSAARQMLKQGSGVIIFLTGSPARPHGPGTSGIGAAFGAVENLTRTMAIELGPAGVRVVCLRTAANPDTRTIQDTTDVIAKRMNITSDQATASLAEGTMLKVSPRTSDTARAAAFLASDRACMMTGTILNSSAGAVMD